MEGDSEETPFVEGTGTERPERHEEVPRIEEHRLGTRVGVDGPERAVLVDDIEVIGLARREGSPVWRGHAVPLGQGLHLELDCPVLYVARDRVIDRLIGIGWVIQMIRERRWRCDQQHQYRY